MPKFKNNIIVKQGKYKNRGVISNIFIDRHLNTVKEMLRVVSCSKVLDAGCGEGIPLLYLNEEVKGKDVYGIDCDEEKIIMIQKNIPQGTFKIGSIYSIPFNNKEFDLTLCLEVLEHLETPAKALKEVRRVSYGTVLFSVPNEPIWSLLNLLRFKYISRLGNTPDHQQQWSAHTFLKLLKNDFKVMHTRIKLPWTFVLCSPKE